MYGISPEEYEKLLSKQEGVCAICKVTSEEYKKNFHVDHCHKTGKIRGLLCQKCNLGLGQFKDSPEFLLSAVEYLHV